MRRDEEVARSGLGIGRSRPSFPRLRRGGCYHESMKPIQRDSETFTEVHRALALARHAEHMAERTFVRNPMLVISAIAALVTMAFVPPSPAYLSYIDWHTIICLFCILAVLEAIDSSGFLEFMAHSIVERVSNTRALVFALVTVTLGCSMVLSNDMTLVTVLPLALLLLKSVHREKRVPFVFIMITLTANLGGMLLPFGNPHNLYLYSVFNVDFGQFVLTMAPPLIFSMALIYACCATVHPGEFHYKKPDEIRIPRHRVELYLVLFGICIAMTVNAISYVVGALVIVAALAIVDRDVFTKTDYSLILTFVCFFVMSGNVAQIGAVASFLNWLMQVLGVFPTALISSQVISNVPSAILLSHFTDNWAAVALGTNIGAVGTPISSMATLITLRQYQKSGLGSMSRFVGKFEVYNFIFLGVVAAFEILAVGMR